MTNKRVTISNQYLDIGCSGFFKKNPNMIIGPRLTDHFDCHAPFKKTDQFPITICEMWNKSSMWVCVFQMKKKAVSKETQSSMPMKNFETFTKLFIGKKNEPQQITRANKWAPKTFGHCFHKMLIFDQNKSESI